MTVHEQIMNITEMYKEPAGQPSLSEVDILTYIAFEKELSGCGNMNCLFNEAVRLRENPDRYVDIVLGAKGTSKRTCFEMKAKELMDLARKYMDSSTEYTDTHPLATSLREAIIAKCE